jgi:hypothetical protein
MSLEQNPSEPLELLSIGALGRAAQVTLLVSASAALVAMVPCFGILNWLVAPLCLAPTLIGLVGLLLPERKEYPGPLLAGLVGGLALLCLSLARLALGGGLI